MKKKILFVITKSNFGGAQRYVYDLARSLPSEKYDVAVAFGGSGILQDKLEAAGIRTLPLGRLGRDVHFFDDLSSFWQLYKLFKDEHPDVVHLNSSKGGGIGACAARIARVPCILFTAHGWAFNEKRPWWQKGIIVLLAWFTVILSHTTIAVSKNIKHQMRHLPFTQRKMVVIYNGVDVAGVLSQKEAREVLRHNNEKIRNIPEDAVWVGTVAELHPTKGHRYAIDAIERLISSGYNVYFIIISDGEERYELKKYIQKHNLEDRVILFGFLDSAPQYLKALDIFTLTSISEALSLSILEAGLSERAVVASNVGGIPEIITHKENGFLVPKKNPAAIAEALIRYIEHPEVREVYGKALREKVASVFSLERMVEETQRLYTKN